MMRRHGLAVPILLLVAVLALGAGACKVKVVEPDWEALPSDWGGGQDSGASLDLGTVQDPGTIPDAGPGVDRIEPVDPGEPDDPGEGADPGAAADVQDKEVIAEACGSLFNPSCTPQPCDDGDDRTQGDACVWQADGNGADVCACAGTPLPGSACVADLNPQCQEAPCLLGGLIPGRCGKTSTTSPCACIPADPCSRLTNPTCLAEQCVSGPSSLGYCSSDILLLCGCEAAEADPCGSKVNPVCASHMCLRSGRLGFGQCKTTDLGCQCLAIDAEAPCGSAANPECNASPCPLAGDKKGACRQNAAGVCICDSI